MARIDIPCLNVIGGKSGLCPIEGCKYVTQHVPDCQEVRLPSLLPTTRCLYMLSLACLLLLAVNVSGCALDDFFLRGKVLGHAQHQQ